MYYFIVPTLNLSVTGWSADQIFHKIPYKKIYKEIVLIFPHIFFVIFFLKSF